MSNDGEVESVIAAPPMSRDGRFNDDHRAPWQRPEAMAVARQHRQIGRADEESARRQFAKDQS